MSLLLYGIGIVVCILLSGFFSASEMAFSSANRLRLENARDDGSKAAAVALKLLDSFDRTLSAILIGNNLVNIAASSLGSVFVILLTGSDKNTWMATVGLTLLIIIFGETMPKITAKQNATNLATRYARPLQALSIVLLPLIWAVVGLISLLTRSLKGEEGEDPEEAVEELQSIIETAKDEEVLDEDQTELVQAAIDFSEISAAESMTARVDMMAIDLEDDPEEIRASVEDCPYSRLPVYEGSVDHMVGILSVNRYLKALADNPDTDLRSLLMKPCYIYKTMKLPQVLTELRKNRQHLAIVVDEYGGTLGVISMEDVLEEIVGDIWDETDTVENEVTPRGQNVWELDGDMIFSDFLELMDLREDAMESESETIGGWTVESLGTFPKEGDSFVKEGLKITVLAMDGLRVEKLLAEKLPETEEQK